MPHQMAENVFERLPEMEGLYHQLILLVAPSGSGKTAALQTIAKRMQTRVVNLNLEAATRLLDLTERQRALQASRIVEEIVGGAGSPVLLDNIEILFDLSLQQDPLRLLQNLSRRRTVVASWNGAVQGKYLVYAKPDHPEYRRYPAEELVTVCPEATV